MANNDVPDPVAPPTGGGRPDTNGYHDAAGRPGASLVRERFRLRAQCAKLRHWCRGLLDTEGTDGVLPPEVERELRETPPGMSMDDAFAALRVISQGEPLPASAAALTDDVTALAAERQRLSGHYFSLIDAVFPDEPPFTDEYFEELADQPPGPSISEVLDHLERETGGKS
jgi:hypothetical protein